MPRHAPHAHVDMFDRRWTSTIGSRRQVPRLTEPPRPPPWPLGTTVYNSKVQGIGTTLLGVINVDLNIRAVEFDGGHCNYEPINKNK